jgi:hypothetical protein
MNGGLLSANYLQFFQGKLWVACGTKGLFAYSFPKKMSKATALTASKEAFSSGYAPDEVHFSKDPSRSFAHDFKGVELKNLKTANKFSLSSGSGEYCFVLGRNRQSRPSWERIGD